MSTGILQVQGDKIVGNDGKPVLLRGAGLGGWMNMENFITGYPGQDSQHRASMLKILGPEKSSFFFDKFLENFFTDADAEFFSKKLGLNCLRVPFNYHHFEDDMNPRVLKKSGFKHLDRVVEICAKHGIYTILDLHAVPGGQNPDWHSDNVTNHAAFWDHKDFQDRVIWLWENIAARYKDETFVAGYNLLNEPCDPLHYRLPRFYERIEEAVRKVDGKHILWLDGNTFSMEFKYFDEMRELENTVFGLHDYAMMGFPKGQKYVGSEEQKDNLEKQFLRKAEFMRSIRGPIWNGEWGPVYADPSLDTDHESINEARYNLLGQQLRIYDKYNVHWNIWLYKDIGLQGMVHLDPSSKYMQTIAPFLEKKRLLQLDAWGRRPSPATEAVIEPLVDFIDKHIPQSKQQYPTPWATERQIVRIVNQLWMAGCLSDEFAEQFKDLSMEDLEECAKSFAFERCLQRDGLNRALQAHASVESSGGEDLTGSKVANGSAGKDVELELD